ncbi:hypothetical protein [Nonomuraea sp. NPDC049784]|uniref:hypothetical protein n=1 Tax=Nonomuraea sp. NPDC049784 TaxID=3154361 RepID=UPI0033C1B511
MLAKLLLIGAVLEMPEHDEQTAEQDSRMFCESAAGGSGDGVETEDIAGVAAAIDAAGGAVGVAVVVGVSAVDARV